jgi:acyl-CoA thioester hydrolase
MIRHEIRIRVRYGETDRMGYLHHGNYALYFEEGRTELLRALGQSYREMEDGGILLPVAAMTIRYQAPARYDELLTIRTRLEALPRSTLTFAYEALGEDGSPVAQGETVHAFVDRTSRRVRRPPASFLELLRRHWGEPAETA